VLSRRKSVHPVREWLNGLKWDGKHRMQTELPQVLGHAADSFAATLLTRWMVSRSRAQCSPAARSTRRSFWSAPRARGSRSFFNALAGDWFTDSPVNVGDKDGKLVMRRRGSSSGPSSTQ
jgi:putative DNA primase/helicase